MTTQTVISDTDLIPTQQQPEQLCEELKQSQQELTEPELQQTIQIQPNQQQVLEGTDNRYREEIIEGSVQDPNVQNVEEELDLKKIKSQEELKMDISQNQKILASLSFNIDDLFKKISSLTEQVQSQIGSKPAVSSSSLDKIQLPRKKFELPAYNSHKLIPVTPVETEALLNVHKQEILQQLPGGISMRMFQIGQSLGHGKFGQVLQCKHKDTGCLFALKKIFKSTISQYKMHEQFLIELECMKRMNHPNIVRSYTAFTDDFHIFLILQYAYGQQLTKKFNCPQDVASKIIHQVLLALKYMHEKGVVHRDLKPENIIIDESGTIKICDFGWANLISKQVKQKNEEAQNNRQNNEREERKQLQQKMQILCGTLDYVCPEMVNGVHYTKEVDLWSVGVLAYQLLFGVAPFKAENKSGTFAKVKDLQYTFPGAYRFSGDAMDFISQLLKPEEQRMRIQECLNHPFIKKHKKEETKNAEPLSEQFQQVLKKQLFKCQ